MIALLFSRCVYHKEFFHHVKIINIRIIKKINHLRYIDFTDTICPQCQEKFFEQAEKDHDRIQELLKAGQ